MKKSNKKVKVEIVARCSWVTEDKIYQEYHDKEWGKAVHDDNKLFEMLSLEGAQAGLNWLTVLKKREGYRKLFHNFDIQTVSQLKKKDIDKILQDESIIRHRGKVESVVNNAQCILKLLQDEEEEFKTFDQFVWSFAPSKTRGVTDLSTNAPIDQAKNFSVELKKRGFKFVGPTILHAFFQAVGILDDHSPGCHLHIADEVKTQESSEESEEEENDIEEEED